MYLSRADIQQTRLHTIDHLHAASRVWVEATERLSELSLRAGRQALEEGRLHLAELADSHPLGFAPLPIERLADWRGESASLVSECFDIIGDAQQAILQMARDQVAALDKVLLRQLDRAALHADATGEAAIGHIKTAIGQAEAHFNDLADAAVRGGELVEEQVRQVAGALADNCEEAPEADPADDIATTPPARSRLSRRSRSRAD